jgi:plasmid stabilization system protein ParE
MVKYKVDWDESTESDLEEIFYYIACQALAPAAAVRLVKKIKQEGDNLKYSPHCFVYDEKRGLRRKVVGNYLIFFTIDENKKRVLIRQIVHGNRDLTQALR